jgi:hypothetical protein
MMVLTPTANLLVPSDGTMQKIASPQELQAELRAVMAFIHGHGPNGKPGRQAIAAKLRELADRVAASNLVLAGDERVAALREAESAFDKELKPYFQDLLNVAWKGISRIIDDIDEGRWPDKRLEYAVMRYKPLSMTDEDFREALFDSYMKWKGEKTFR